MNRIIWALWLQGEVHAPPIVRACLDSWRNKNPTWDVRVLDAKNVSQYVSIKEFIDLTQQDITAASLSDIIRILLLHEYGGVWVDATTFCNRGLDEWLPDHCREGFFAFDRPAVDRPLSSWFLAAERGHPLVLHWCEAVLSYWKGRRRADNYFWFHRCFRLLCETNKDAAQIWQRVPKVSADGPHAIQALDFYADAASEWDKIDWTTPVFKLTYRVDQARLSDTSFLSHFLNLTDFQQENKLVSVGALDQDRTFASLSVSTENLGDHIQIVACHEMLKRFDVVPSYFVDRDAGLATTPDVPDAGNIPIILNGWFKHGNDGWPPSTAFSPLFIGFHIRLFQAPCLLAPPSREYCRQHAPIGCRDPYTRDLLRNADVSAYLSHCLTLSLPYRVSSSAGASKTFVVSRDSRILDLLPPERGPFTYISHYTGSTDFDANIVAARNLLEQYRSESKLIVTTLLHCALPAIAMGIPVIVFYPLNSEAGQKSDVERFSSLALLTRIYRFTEMDQVDWSPKQIDVSNIKLELRDRCATFLSKVGVHTQALGPIAPSEILPVPAG